MGLGVADDAIRDDSAVCVIENDFLADRLADHQQLLIDTAFGAQKAATTGDQAVNARQIPLQMPKLLLDSLAYLVETGSLLLGHSKKLLPRLFPVCTRLMAKIFSDLSMH